MCQCCWVILCCCIIHILHQTVLENPESDRNRMENLVLISAEAVTIKEYSGAYLFFFPLKYFGGQKKKKEVKRSRLLE